MSSQDINPSTTSLQSTQTTDTTTSSTPLTQKGKSNKNYPFAFANLQRKYGTTGNLPRPQAGGRPPSSSSSIAQDGGASSGSADTLPHPGPSKPSSLSTIQEQSPSSPDAPKNFEAAFGSLSSSYGVSSSLPTLPRKNKDKEKGKEKEKKRSFASSLFKKGK